LHSKSLLDLIFLQFEGRAGTERRGPITLGEVELYAMLAGLVVVGLQEGAKQRVGGKDPPNEFETFPGAAGVAMDGNAGFELAIERLIPVEPSDFSWQGLSPEVPIVPYSKFIGHSEIRSISSMGEGGLQFDYGKAKEW
jgi:hypothetical protein